MASREIKIPIILNLDDRASQLAAKAIQSVEKTTVQASRAAASLAQAQARLEQAQARSAQSATKVSQAQSQVALSAQKLATAQNQTAISAQKLSQAEQATAQSVARTSAEQDRAAVAALRLATAQDRAAQASQRAAAQAARTSAAHERSVQNALELASAYDRTSKAFVTPRGDMFGGLKSELASTAAGVLGVGAALSAVTATAQSFADAIEFKAELDANTAAIDAQINTVRTTSIVWQEATAFADRYKLTQEQVTAAVQESIPILKTSTRSTTEILTALARLGATKPAEGIQGAAFALAELQSGDIQSLVERFGVSRDRATEMRDAIRGGADAVTVLTQYLNDAGVSMQVLEAQTQGAQAALKDYRKAQEDLKIAQAEFAQGPGIALLNEQVTITRGLTRLLKGDFDEMTQSVQASAAGTAAFFQALAEGKSVAEANAAATQASAEAAGLLAQAQEVGTSGGRTWGDAQLLAANAAETATDATATYTAALQQDAAQSLLSAATSQELAMSKAVLEQQARAAAQALILNGAAGAQEAARLAASSSLVDQLTAAYYRLGISAQQAAQLTIRAVQFAAAVSPAFQAALPGVQTVVKSLSDAKKGLENFKFPDPPKVPKLGGAGGGAARVSEEQKTADQIVQIAQRTADKLAAIDEKNAQQRIAAARKLADTLRTTAAEFATNAEVDDLDLLGKDLSEEEKNRLADREAAQAKARISQIEAVKEAQQIAADQDAQLAEDTFEARQNQIESQQSLDEKYYAKQRELAGDTTALEALETQYQEGTAAISRETDVRIGLAQREAAERAAAVEAEKQAVLDAASAEVAGLGKTGDAASSAAGRVNSLRDALGNLPKQVTTTIEVKEVRSSSGGGSSSASAGSSSGGGSQAPKPSTPPKASAQRVGAAKASGRVSAMGVVDDGAGDALGLLTGGTTPALPTTGSGSSGGGGGGSAAAPGDTFGRPDDSEMRDAQADLRDQLSAEVELLRLLAELTELREKVREPGPPVSLMTIQELADEAEQIGQIIRQRLLPASEADVTNMERYSALYEAATSIVTNTLDIREAAATIPAPLSLSAIVQAADDATQIAQVMQARLLPAAEADVEAIGRYADFYASATSIVKDTLAVREAATEIPQPLDLAVVRRAADDAMLITQEFASRILPTAEDQVDQASRYAGLVTSATSAIRDTLSLTQDLFANYSRPSDSQIAMVASDAQRITDAFAQSAKTIEQSDAGKAWAEAVGTTFQAVSTGLETIDRINLTQVALDPAQLATYQASALALMDTADVLGARAAAIPANSIAALQNVTSALNNQATMMINMAAVPFGNLPQAAGAFASTAPSGPSITFGPGAIQINQVQGENVERLAERVSQKIGQRVQSRR